MRELLLLQLQLVLFAWSAVGRRTLHAEENSETAIARSEVRKDDKRSCCRE
jgi:hypothetical protein